MTVTELLTKHGIALADTKPGRYYTTCPQCSAKRSKAHQGEKVLGVTIEAGGGVRWGCNHCSWTGPEKGSGGRPELQAHVYRDADGAERFRKVRNLPGREPRFWLEQPDGRGGWKKGTKGVDTAILYRTDEVRKAIAEGRVVACVEGEKDADSLWRIGIAATCNAHGASEPGKRPKWTKGHSEQLAGADIVVFNDNDPAGYEHADAICKLSLGVAKRVRRLDLKNDWPEIPLKGDVSDWLAVGGEHTPERLKALIAAAPDFVPAGDGKSEAPGASETAAAPDDDVELEKLARMSGLDYERARVEAAKRLGIERLSMLDTAVKTKRAALGLNGGDDKQGSPISFPNIEPWPEPIDGAALIAAVATAIGQHVIMPEHSRTVAALWVAHTHLVSYFQITPRLVVRSPVKRCGKTTLLDILACLVLRPLLAASITTSVVFRVVEKHRPCLLIDEADQLLRDNEELRKVFDSGHRRGTPALRNVGDDHEPRQFATYAACAIAAIGNALPDTTLDRSVAIDLERRKRSEPITPFRLNRTAHLTELARKIARWVADNSERIGAAEPAMPDGVFNRDADKWEPLLAIADTAGGPWPARARKAAAKVCSGENTEEGRSLIEVLLNDIYKVFAERNVDKLRSEDLAAALADLPGQPWAEMGRVRKPLSKDRLARMLKARGVGIVPERIRVTIDGEEKQARGYVLARFKEVFERYVAENQRSARHSVTNTDEMGTSSTFQGVTGGADVTGRKSQKSNNDGLCDTVTGRKGGSEGQGLPEREVDEVAEWVQAFAARHVGEPDFDALIAQALRERLLNKYNVRPEDLDIEAERVMARAFGPLK